MASLSSQSTLLSSFGSWNHDVFLSFRGTDTRKTFVDHLYSALVQQGIYTYKDDETLPRGEAIGPSLLKAIEESRIAVIILSENYADSSWCLQELAHIMKCKDERGQIVMPIFYHIDPSEVRNQKRKYGEAFAKHESEMKKVESWRKALMDVGNLSGWEPKHIANGHEAKCIKEIVDTISDRLCMAISSDNEGLIGIEDRLQDLKSKIEMESRGVLMVGIWGVGGGGKTTLASSLYNEVSSNFDGCCFLENVREESSKFGLPKLQNEIMSIVLTQTQMKVNRVEDGRRLIKSRFCRKKVLIVLDDIDHLDQLKALAGSHDWFGEGSRIIITTRDNHLLNAHKVNMVYKISLLNNGEAIKLFCKHAPRQSIPIDDYKMLSRSVVSYAGGLPLALVVLGSFLCDKDTGEWRSALARLKEVPDTDIVEKLKISYDGLKPMEKELFLDIACFFREKKKDEAMVILDACGFHPTIGIKVLIQKALITVSKAGRFYMHDMIQEMGHYIVREENPTNPEKHSRIWQMKDVLKICAMDAMQENDRIEALLFQQHWGVPPPSLPEVVASMTKLRGISCVNFPATSFSGKFQPTKLCYLTLRSSRQQQLWEGYKYLPNLKVLDLSYSINLVKTPDFDGLPCLERMTLKHCEMLTEIHPSIGNHERLIFVNLGNCKRLKVFPPIFRMKKLETLILSHCLQLCKFPQIQNTMDNLVELCLERSKIKIVPSSIGRYCTNLIYLDLRKCIHLHSIEGNFHLLKQLEGLYLEGCDQLTNIPSEGLFDVKCSLRVFSSFKNLHQGMVSMKIFGFSSSLRRLNLRRCNLVDRDISSVFCDGLANLQALDLSGNNFSRLHSSLSQLPRLKFLNLSHCLNLVELPILPSSIGILIAFGCDSLDIAEDFPRNHLKWLWKVALSARNCNGQKILQSMLQGNAIEDYYISIQFVSTYIPIRGFARETFTLQLPWNWHGEFSGFLVYVDNWCFGRNDGIIIKDVMGIEKEDDGLDEGEEGMKMSGMCYISFGSLRHTSWWNSTHQRISFFIKDVSLKVELVRRRSQSGDSIESTKGTTSPSEFGEDEPSNGKTFKISHDSRASVKISWVSFDYNHRFYHRHQ